MRLFTKSILFACLALGIRITPACAASRQMVNGKMAIQRLEKFLGILNHPGVDAKGAPCSVWGTFSDKQYPVGFVRAAQQEKISPWTNIVVHSQTQAKVFALASYNSAEISESTDKITVTYDLTMKNYVTIDRKTKTVTVDGLTCQVDDLMRGIDH